MSKQRMCPHCRAFIDHKAKSCEYCENDLPAPAARRIRREQRLRTAGLQFGFTTKILLLVNAGIFAASFILTVKSSGDAGFLGGIDGQVLHMLGAKFRLSILLESQWWRLITANFLHGSVLHLAFNSMSLFNLGPLAEQVFGTSRFVVLYLATGLAGFLASTYWSSSLSIGASAAICGLIGALYGFGRLGVNSQLKSVALRWMIAIAAFGLFFPGIDNAAHFGGLATGFALAYAVGVPGPDETKESIWKGASVGALAVTVWAFAMAYRNFAVATA